MQLSQISLALTRLGGVFSPAHLFTGGVQGAWYDPSDLTTLFQDSAGTTPVTAVEQAVGLMLDKRSTPYSVYFDGTGDSLAAGTTSTFDFMHNASALFTFECWVYRTVGSTVQILFSNINTSPNIGVIIGFSAGNKLFLEIYRGVSSTFVISTETSATIPTNQWTHVAVTYDQSLASNNAKFYINGVFDSQATKTANAPSGSNASFAGYIGTTPSNGLPYTGYISNLRIVNAVLPISLPTAPLTPVTGTALLTCGTTWSGNPAITANGDARGAGLNPFTASPVGNHAFQTTSASRPTLRARYNLLTYTQDFSNAAWVTAASIGRSVTKGTTTGTRPDGTIGTVDTLTFSAVSAGELVFLYQNAGQTLLNVQATESIYVRVASGTATIYLNILDMVAVPSAGNFVAGSAETVTTSWKRIALTGTRTASSGNAAFTIGFDTRAAAGQINAAPFTLEVWGAQLVPTAVFPSNTYQRIGAATDYATGAAFPPYLFFDGTDDSMLTNSVDFATVTSDGQARRNLLLNPTQFDDAYWVKGAPSPVVTISANSTTDPFGGSNADTMTETATTASHGVASGLFSFVSGTSYAMSAYAKNAPGGRGFFQLAGFGIGAAGANVNANFDLVNGTVTAQSGGTGSMQDVGNGWYRCIFVFTCGTSASERFNLRNITSSTAPAFESYLGDITKGLYIYGAQLETGSTATAFQNIGTDKMLVVAGVTKNAAGTGQLVELSATVAVNNGAFSMPSDSGTNNWGTASKGTGSVLLAESATNSYPAPITTVNSAIHNLALSSNVATLRVNGAQVAVSGAGAGGGNFGNYPLYIGSRGGTTLRFNGNIYSLVIAGQSYSSGQISSTESWVAAKTPLGTI